MNKPTALYFDMDGTIADLYGVENWLQMLINEETTPYEIARPLCDMARLTTILSALKENGIIIGVISWGSKKASLSYGRRIRKAKIEWLRQMGLIEVMDEIHVVKYGTPKHKVAKISNALLIDDDAGVREAWEVYSGDTINPLEVDLIEVLARLVKEGE